MLVAPVAPIVIVPVWLPIESPLILAPTLNDPVLVPVAAEPPFIFSQAAVDVAVQLSVPVPLFVIVTNWLAGLAPF